ncbi:SAM-dependent methyltransferase [Moraxella oblonga]|uniref:SAM-dependent methyltransferase n=1 Tax=Moraxella oblonga TaxID=200413 RepID=UPI0008372BB2|nr:SAM-dependent methyltransferase [Moraxella oblonga]
MLSHCFNRLFDIHQLHTPRDFVPIANVPICLEIGAGKGKHALQFAQNNPDKMLYAVERTANKFEAMQKLKTDNTPNLFPIHADAIAWSVFALYPKQITECFILYPNPEPHNKNQRFTNMPFFEFLLSRMADNATITIASNIDDYIKESEKNLQKIWQLPFIKNTIPNHSQRTHFEIKYLARGELCQELIITKPTNYKTRFDDILPKHLWDTAND